MSAASSCTTSCADLKTLPLWQRLIGTSGNPYGLIARLVVGGVMLPHGLQKTFGMFGGHGWANTYQAFTESMHIPGPFAAIAILTESVGAVLIILGLAGRLQALALSILMIVAVAMGHFKNGFFMNWFGNQAGEGFEYHILFVGLCAIVLLGGSGMFSLDHLLTRIWVRKAKSATGAKA